MLRFIFYFVLICTVPHIAMSTHETVMADYVEARTVKLSGGGGSGTGFVVEAPSGMKYILTNRHVCEVGNLFVNPPKGSKERATRFVQYELSETTDLCIGQAPPYLTKALKLASSGPFYRQNIGVTGHPFGSDAPVLTRGVILSKTKVWHPWSMIEDKAGAEQCTEDGGVPVRQWFWHICLKQINSYLTTVEIFPGNSGSAAVDFWGNVIGVVWGADTRTNHGVLVPLEDVKEFLRVY